MDYKSELVKIVNKALKDEISSAIQYTVQAAHLDSKTEKATGDHFLEHAKEEFTHFVELIGYATKQGFINEVVIDINFDQVKDITEDLAKAQDTNIKLEKGAVSDYMKAAQLAKENNDSESEKFFIELMNDEQVHVDDIEELVEKGSDESTTRLGNILSRVK